VAEARPGSEKFVAIVQRAYVDSSFRGKIIYFPERVVAEYELDPDEAYVLRTGDLSKIELPEELMDRARWVWDLTHMASGE
jgi:hypothetical protein